MQVLQYLSTNTLAQLKEDFGIKVSQNELYPYLYVLNYDQINSPKARTWYINELNKETI